ncbi:MAG: FtsX-like permease family protein [Ginsengibacter sp.]
MQEQTPSTKQPLIRDSNSLQPGWLLQMAWRDSRRSRSRLFLFISSVILGIAALVAIYSLGNNLKDEINNQAASLLGADLEISGNKAPTVPIQQLLDSIGGAQSEQRNFASMVFFPKNGGTRLVQVRALSGQFPFYGSLESNPVSSANSFRDQQQALVDETLMLQFGAKIGDSIKIGEVTFAIAGELLSAPGQTGFAASVAPVIYIPLGYLEQTKLMQKGSRISYHYYIKFDGKVDDAKLTDQIKPILEEEEYDYATVQTQKEDTGRSFGDLTRFLSLVGFIALLLGCTGVASAVHVYVKEKINSIAILRCLGVRASQAFIIFLLQILIVGFLGSLAGAFLGVIIQQFLPVLLKDFLPITIVPTVSWTAIWEGILLGTCISVLFALLPLLSIRKVSPLQALRASFEPADKKRDPLKWIIFLLIILFIYGFSYIQLGSFVQAAYFTASIGIALGVLTAMASSLIWLVKRFFPSSWNFLWRQGLANLYRPNNQTTILIISIGLGTALISTLFFVQSILLSRVSIAEGEGQPNMVLFDIQRSQKDGVADLIKEFGMPLNENIPVVNMRLEKINGKTSSEIIKDSTQKISGRLFSREFRVTYRDSVTSSEKITKGKWTGEATGNGIAPISLEENYARRNGLSIGDTLTFNVQGVMILTIVGSFREVDWSRIRTNFLVVFPKGVIDDAPQFAVILTKVPSKNASAKFQQEMVREYPNVSIIDLGLVLNILNSIMEKIGFVIRFMGGFSILTGLVVLISSVLISKYQRLQESILLRTLGGSRKQILIIIALEYFFLGALAAFVGILLSLAGSWALAHFLFDTPFRPDLIPVLVLGLIVCTLTVVIGVVNSIGLLNKPPLEVLRKEV